MENSSKNDFAHDRSGKSEKQYPSIDFAFRSGNAEKAVLLIQNIAKYIPPRIIILKYTYLQTRMRSVFTSSARNIKALYSHDKAKIGLQMSFL